MASEIREFVVDAPPEKVWAAVGDFAKGPMLTSPGFYSDCRMEEPDVRAMTFAADGTVVRERLVARDEEARRIVWAWIDDQVEHDNGSMQVFPEGETRARVVWIHDTLPDELADRVVAPAMDQSVPIIQEALAAPTEEASAGSEPTTRSSPGDVRDEASNSPLFGRDHARNEGEVQRGPVM